eukprot:scaffold244002_cov18-Tisochrysis_lutea.AAC.2
MEDNTDAVLFLNNVMHEVKQGATQENGVPDLGHGHPLNSNAKKTPFLKLHYQGNRRVQAINIKRGFLQTIKILPRPSHTYTHCMTSPKLDTVRFTCCKACLQTRAYLCEQQGQQKRPTESTHPQNEGQVAKPA